MKKCLWVVPLLLLLVPVAANANSITTIILVPNDGSGENFAFNQLGLNQGIVIDAGTPFDFFNDINGFAPGTSVGGPTGVFFTSGSITIRGVTHDLTFNGDGSLFMSSIALPTDGTPSITVPVTLVFSALATTADTGRHVTIWGKAKGTLTLGLGSDGNYYPAGGIRATSTVPEWSTVGLMGTGVIGIFALRSRAVFLNRLGLRPMR